MMESRHTLQKEITFVYSFHTNGFKSTLTVPVNLPLKYPVAELGNQLILAHNLPCYVEEDIQLKLKEFIEKQISQLDDCYATALLDGIKREKGEGAIDGLVKKWARVFNEEVREHSRPEPLTNEMVFSEVYHTLIHGPHLQTLLNLEHTYALAIHELVTRRDQDLFQLQTRQAGEMSQAMQKLGVTHTDDQINLLAQRHLENMQLIESKWASELSNLKDTQKREYRDWVMTVHEDTQASDGPPDYMQRLNGLSPNFNLSTSPVDGDKASMIQREESFTVHLGAQLKATHNLRLISADVLNFCRHKPQKEDEVVMPDPQRLSTALSLYSNKLSGLVLLVDSTLSSYTGIKQAFARVCEQSTDFHFTDLEHQLEETEESVQMANDDRAPKMRGGSEDLDRLSLRSSGSGASERDDRQLRLYPGDCYISHHSNLSETHIVFHTVTDDSVRSPNAELSSRHPVILGYRNVLKACFRYDIETITLPLLLVHEMTEEMTIPWCMKRAELVFKCVKGFMMELATWSGQASRNIQFLVPKDLSDETFGNISQTLASIFRMSNPVIAKSHSSY